MIHVAARHVADEALVGACAARSAGLSNKVVVTRWAAQALSLGPRLQLLVNSQLLIILALTRLVRRRHLLLAHLVLE